MAAGKEVIEVIPASRLAHHPSDKRELVPPNDPLLAALLTLTAGHRHLPGSAVARWPHRRPQCPRGSCPSRQRSALPERSSPRSLSPWPLEPPAPQPPVHHRSRP